MIRARWYFASGVQLKLPVVVIFETVTHCPFWKSWGPAMAAGNSRTVRSMKDVVVSTDVKAELPKPRGPYKPRHLKAGMG